MSDRVCEWRAEEGKPICGEPATWDCWFVDGRFDAGRFRYCSVHKIFATLALRHSSLPSERVDRILGRFTRLPERIDSCLEYDAPTIEGQHDAPPPEPGS